MRREGVGATVLSHVRTAASGGQHHAVTADQAFRLALGSVVLLALTAVVLTSAGVRLGRAPYLAVLRGALQLAVVGVVLRGVLSVPPTGAAVLAVMLATASWTATSRIHGFERVGRSVVLAIIAGAATALTVTFAVGVLPFQGRYVIALGGIVIGNAMTGATLAGRQLRAGLIARRDEVEAWLSVGATPRQAVLDIARQAAGEALVPALDQTRTTGLVTLPGAFIGALLGGANPTQAARFQLVVLVTIIAAQSIVAVLIVRLLGAPQVLPEGDSPPRGAGGQRWRRRNAAGTQPRGAQRR